MSEVLRVPVNTSVVRFSPLYFFFLSWGESSGIQNQIYRLPRQFHLYEANVFQEILNSDLKTPIISIKSGKSNHLVMTLVLLLSPLELRQSAITVLGIESLLRRGFILTFAFLYSCSILKVITHWKSKQTFMLSSQNSPNSACSLTFPLFCTFSWSSFDVMTNE